MGFMERAEPGPRETDAGDNVAPDGDLAADRHRTRHVGNRANGRAQRRPAHGPWLQVGSSRGFEWHRAELAIPDLPAELAGLRILHISDFHAWAHWDPGYDQLIERVKSQRPDMILFTGDFVDCKHDYTPAMPVVQRVMEGLTSRLGTYVILGNHDDDLLAASLGGWGLHQVHGRRICLESGAATIELIGIGGLERRDLDPRFIASIPPKKPGSVRIVLSHFPDTLRRVGGLRPDLFLAGHTHGGQICLPGGRPISSHDSLPRRFSRGIHHIAGTWLVVNRGFGFSSLLRVRTFCPAEVIEMTLVRGEAPGRDVEL
jgi:predicted MPP superfamily phosphohydrolase